MVCSVHSIHLITFSAQTVQNKIKSQLNRFQQVFMVTSSIT